MTINVVYRVQCSGPCRRWLSIPDGYEPGEDIPLAALEPQPTAARAGMWPDETAARYAAFAAGWSSGTCPDCRNGETQLTAVARPGQPETDGEAQGAGETLPPPEGPEYTPCACDHIEPEHEPNAGACWSCDCEAYRATPPAPLRRSDDDCPGFPEQCPNIRPVDPNPPAHLGGIRCGCADQPADTAQQPKEA